MISAIICTYNRERFLSQLFKSIEKQTLSPDNYEVVIVDNNSTDNTMQLCEDFISVNPHMNIKYIIETKQGLSYARNRGIDESTGEYVTFLDDDAILTDEYLATVYDHFVCHPDVCCIGGRILIQYESEPPPWMSVFMSEMFGHFDLGKRVKKFKSGKYPRGSNMSFRISVFNEIGKFNVQLGRKGGNMIGSEEKEFFYRMFSSGFKAIYLPEALVYHYIPDTRLEDENVKKQIMGIGISESILSRKQKTGTYMLYFKELLKWFASFALMFFYVLTGNPQKGFFLIKFRYYILLGIRQA